MQINYFILTAFVIAMLSSCSSMKVGYEYDREADFTEYKTYDYTNDAQELPIGKTFNKMVLDAVDNEMANRGFSKSQSPDILLGMHVKEGKSVNASASTAGMGHPWNPYGYGSGFNYSSVTYVEQNEGTLFIYLVDTRSSKVIWQGSGTKEIDVEMSDEQREKAINSSINKIMANYPPPEKAVH